MSQEVKNVVKELKEEDLSEEEIIWYAVNMHHMDEAAIREELQGLQGDTGQPVSPASKGLSDHGYWIALKAFIFSFIFFGFISQLFDTPKLSSTMEERVSFTVFVFSFTGLVIWSVLRQVEIAAPGSRWLCAIRPIIYMIFIVAGHQTLFTFLWPDYPPGLQYFMEMALIGLLFFEMFTLLRRWIVPVGILFFIGLHVLMLNYVGLIAIVFKESLWADQEFLELLSNTPPYVFSDASSSLEKTAIILQSFAEVMVCWLLFTFCGNHRPGKSLSEWGAMVKHMPQRLFRGEYGLPRSFWYFGVVGWIPVRFLSQYAVHLESNVLFMVSIAVNAAFWVLVGFVIWQTAKGYSGAKIWPIGAGLFVVLGMIASFAPLAYLA